MTIFLRLGLLSKRLNLPSLWDLKKAWSESSRRFGQSEAFTQIFAHSSLCKNCECVRLKNQETDGNQKEGILIPFDSFQFEKRTLFSKNYQVKGLIKYAYSVPREYEMFMAHPYNKEINYAFYTIVIRARNKTERAERKRYGRSKIHRDKLIAAFYAWTTFFAFIRETCRCRILLTGKTES